MPSGWALPNLHHQGQRYCVVQARCMGSSSECCARWGAGAMLHFWAQDQVLHLSHALMIGWVGHLSSTCANACERSNGDSAPLFETLGLGHLHSDNKTSSAWLSQRVSGLLSWALQLVRERREKRGGTSPPSTPSLTDKQWGQFSHAYRFTAGSPTHPPTGSALLFCPGEVKSLFFQMLQLCQLPQSLMGGDVNKMYITEKQYTSVNKWIEQIAINRGGILTEWRTILSTYFIVV